jgi:hypothetical protein
MGPKRYCYYTRPGALNMKEAARMQASEDERPRGYSGGGRESCYKVKGLRFPLRVCPLK